MSYTEEWAEAYEQEHGHKPAEPLREIIQHVEKVGAVLQERGREAAQNGERPCPAGFFIELAQYAFHNDLDEETVQILGDLWQTQYMGGYQEGGAA